MTNDHGLPQAAPAEPDRPRTGCDARMKRLLSYTGVLARILRALLPEFRDMEAAEVEARIHGRGPSGRIRGEGQEEKDGRVRLDVRFRVDGPDGPMVVDVEPQFREPSDYRLVRRGLVYADSLVAGQLGVEVVHGRYDDVLPVRVVFIVLHPAARHRWRVRDFPRRERVLYGPGGKGEAERDLLLALPCIVGLGEGRETEYDDIRGFLKTYLDSDLRDAGARRRLLKERYGYEIDDGQMEEMKAMDEAYAYYEQKGIGQGITIGRDQGISIGRNEGRSEERVAGVRTLTRKGFSAREAMDLLDISPAERPEILRRIGG